MRIAAVVGTDGDTIVPLPDGPQLLIWDTATRALEKYDNPAVALVEGRRAAATRFMAEHDVDIACAVPETFCAVSSGIAREKEIRFLRLAAGSRFSDVRKDADKLVPQAVDALPEEELFSKKVTLSLSADEMPRSTPDAKGSHQ